MDGDLGISWPNPELVLLQQSPDTRQVCPARGIAVLPYARDELPKWFKVGTKGGNTSSFTVSY